MCCALPQSITLRHTYVTGPVPVDLYECTNLTTIDLGYNHLTVISQRQSSEYHLNFPSPLHCCIAADLPNPCLKSQYLPLDKPLNCNPYLRRPAASYKQQNPFVHRAPCANPPCLRTRGSQSHPGYPLSSTLLPPAGHPPCLVRQPGPHADLPGPVSELAVGGWSSACAAVDYRQAMKLE